MIIKETWTEMPLCEVITDAVKEYLDQTARAHDCPGFGCKLCAVDGWHYAKLNSIIFRLLEEKGMPWMVRVDHHKDAIARLVARALHRPCDEEASDVKPANEGR